jgi:L-amino acid N-acyltransferase YncA
MLGSIGQFLVMDIEGRMMKRITAVSDYTPKNSILINGEMVVFKLLEKSDEAALKDFFSLLPDHEVNDLRENVRDAATIASWVQALDYSRVLPLVAWEESLRAIVAVSTVHFKEGVYRHVAGVRIVVGTAYRKLGLGSAMIKELVEVGSRLGLYFLKAEILSEKRLAIKAFRQMGFEYKGTFENYFMNRKGETRDVVLMVKQLRLSAEEEMFYEF